MIRMDTRRVHYQTLSRRLTCVAETLDAARCYLAHAAQDAPQGYDGNSSLERTLIGLADVGAFLRDLAAKSHDESEAT